MSRKAWIALGGSLALACVLAIALVVAIAVGGDDDGPEVAPTDVAPAAAPSGAPGEFRGSRELPAGVEECLAEQGIEVPDPTSAVPGEIDIEAIQAALEKCGISPPAGGDRF